VGRRIWQGEEPKRPKWAGPKNKFAKNEKFSSPENDRENHHVYHASHHTFTIKKPRSAHGFLQNPLQKRGFAPN
jgi:hypothetical protein